MPNPSLPSAARSRLLHARAWADAAAPIDRQLSPLGLAAMDALAPASGETVLDIGCGAGQTLCQLAERVGPQGRVVGIDIAPELLDIARRRTHAIDTVSLVEADAQSVDWPRAQADAVFSRFGVMAFADPVAAFGHLRRLLKPDGRLGFVCWQAFDRNPLDHVPLRAAGVRAPVDDAPFSLAEPDVVGAVLGRAGFEAIDIRAHIEPVSSGDLDATAEVLLRVGPLGRIVRENPGLRADAEPRLRAALARLGDPAAVHLTASVWIVTARAPASGST